MSTIANTRYLEFCTRSIENNPEYLYCAVLDTQTNKFILAFTTANYSVTASPTWPYNSSQILYPQCLYAVNDNILTQINDETYTYSLVSPITEAVQTWNDHGRWVTTAMVYLILSHYKN